MPQSTETPPAPEPMTSQGGGKVVSLGDLIELAVESNAIKLEGRLTLGSGKVLEG